MDIVYLKYVCICHELNLFIVINQPDALEVVLCESPSLPDPPTVTLSIEPRSVLEGERVTFTCQAHANPPIMGYRSAAPCENCLRPLKVTVSWSN